MSMKQIQLNDLFDYDYKIYQNDNYFKFSLDSVLLAEFVDIKSNQKNILDLCSGNAPIPMILSKKYGDKVNITGVEIQKNIYDLGIKSIEYNKINNINLINEDVLNLTNIFKNKKFNVITCNPPYFKINDTNLINEDEVKAIARHEIKVNLEEIINISSKLLENQGYLYIVHRPERLSELIYLSHKYKFGIKRIVPIYGNKESKATTILVEAIYNGKDYVSIEPPVIANSLTSYKNIFGK